MIGIPRILQTLGCLLLLSGLGQQPSAAGAEEEPKEVVVGVLRNFPPDYSVDQATGKPVGFAVDIMDAIARKAGLQVRYVLFDDWPVLNQALTEGRIDVIPNMGISEEREKVWSFTAPTQTFPIRIFARFATAQIRSIDDLQGRNVAVVATNVGLKIVQDYGKARPVVCSSVQEALGSLLSGNTDALVYPEPPVLAIARKMKLEGHVKAVGEPLLEVKRAIALARGKPALLDTLDTATRSVVSTPTYREIYEKWYGSPEPYWNARRTAISAGVLIALVVLFLSIGHHLSLRRINRGLVTALGRQREAEASMRESEMRHRHLVESSHDWIWEVDENGTYTYSSPHIKELLGYEPEEVLGKTPFDLMPDQEAKRVGQIFGAIAAERRPFWRLENCNRRKDGTLVMLETNGAPVIGNDGVFRGYRGMDRDITEQKKAMDLLQESEERYRLLVELSPEAVVVHSEGRVDYINDSGAKLLGASGSEALLGRPIRDFVHPDFWERAAERVRRVQESGERTSPAEFLFKRLDGQVCSVEAASVPIRYSGRPAALTVIRDITDRKRAEEERSRLAAALEQTGEAVIMTDAEGIIQYVNPAFEHITGYARQEAVGEKPSLLKSGRQDDAFYRQVWDTLTTGRVWKGRFVNKGKDGGFFEEDATISPIKNASGEITHYVAVKRDVTEQVKMEKQLFQAQKMEAIGTMAGGIAHDFNNILGAISGYTELSLVTAPDHGELRNYLGQIQAASQRATKLVRQILEFSRQSEKEMTSVSVTPLVKEVVKMLREIIPATIEIRLSTRTEADTVLGDATKIHQVLMNLCTNAYQAMKDKGGLLEIDLTRTEVGQTPDGDLQGLKPGPYLELVVKDSGEGIDTDIRERIFEPFFTTKKTGEGTGLGLSVVHGIVKSYGGKITVESRIGEGSAFHVYLPLFAEPREEQTKEEGEPKPAAHGRILLVDDEVMLVDLNTEVLERGGCSVVSRTNSADALKTFGAAPHQFDLVITDQTMPGMTGIELAQRILKIRPDVPVILCTGFLDADIEESATRTGIRAVVAKPLGVRQLIGLVQDLLGPQECSHGSASSHAPPRLAEGKPVPPERPVAHRGSG